MICAFGVWTYNADIISHSADAKEGASVEIHNIDFLLLIWLNIVFTECERGEKMGDNNVVRLNKYRKKRTDKAEAEGWSLEKQWAYLLVSRIARCFFIIGVLIPFVGVAAVFIASPVLGAALVGSFVVSFVLMLAADRIEDWALKKSKKAERDTDKSGGKDPPDAA
jgi:hypothetical protein